MEHIPLDLWKIVSEYCNLGTALSMMAVCKILRHHLILNDINCMKLMNKGSSFMYTHKMTKKDIITYIFKQNKSVSQTIQFIQEVKSNKTITQNICVHKIIHMPATLNYVYCKLCDIHYYCSSCTQSLPRPNNKYNLKKYQCEGCKNYVLTPYCICCNLKTPECNCESEYAIKRMAEIQKHFKGIEINENST